MCKLSSSPEADNNQILSLLMGLILCNSWASPEGKYWHLDVIWFSISLITAEIEHRVKQLLISWWYFLYKNFILHHFPLFLWSTLSFLVDLLDSIISSLSPSLHTIIFFQFMPFHLASGLWVDFFNLRGQLIYGFFCDYGLVSLGQSSHCKQWWAHPIASSRYLLSALFLVKIVSLELHMPQAGGHMLISFSLFLFVLHILTFSNNNFLSCWLQGRLYLNPVSLYIHFYWCYMQWMIKSVT